MCDTSQHLDLNPLGVNSAWSPSIITKSASLSDLLSMKGVGQSHQWLPEVAGHGTKSFEMFLRYLGISSVQEVIST